MFVTPRGVKLLDFGLARPLDEQDLQLTTPGMLMGTPRYLTPEQLQGQPADHRGDLFSTGVVLYEMLTGQPAFNGRTVQEVVHAVVYEHPPALGGSAAVAAVDRIVHKAIAKRPQDRYKSATAMADELRSAVAPHSPWLGMMAWGEIGPCAGRPAFHNYTYPLLLLLD